MALGQVQSLRLRATVIACVLLTGLLAVLPSASQAQSTRTLKLHFTHTGERGTFTYRRNGQYDRKELERINHILRDWRRNEPARMDPALLDLLWEIHRRTGSDEYIHVISAYRSPATNEALRKRSSGVAKNSQHTRGRAMDFFIPGVPLSKLRAIALTAQGGGVGYYPGSGSPFVHVDTGSVRHWPRMTRQQLVSLFPAGETLHVPSDGKPLPGYERAKARQKSGQSIAVASAAGSSGDQASMSNWLKRVFSRGTEEDGRAGRARPAAASQPTAVARAEPQRPESPRAVPAPRPDEVEPEAVADGAETVLAANETGADLPPTPRAVPAKTRALLLAARDRARLVQLASAGAAPEQAPGGMPQERPQAPTAVAALGNRQAIDDDAGPQVSADAALAGLYAAASGGNPEAGAARLMNASVQSEPVERAAGENADPPKSEELAVALLALADMPSLSSPGEGGAGTALQAANALGGSADNGGPPVPSGSAVELAYLAADGAAGAAEAPRRGSEPPLQGSTAAAPAAFVALRLDGVLLQRLMSHETTRTGAFGLLGRPQPSADLYRLPADGGATLALARSGQPRTDRFQR